MSGRWWDDGKTCSHGSTGEAHTRTSTNGHGPDFCQECSEKVGEYVNWPCPKEASIEAGEEEWS